MSNPNECRHEFVYVRTLGGFNIACQHCGDVYGFSESTDPAFLAGFNRNQRRLAAASRDSSNSRPAPRPPGT